MEKFELQFGKEALKAGKEEIPYEDSYEFLRALAAKGSFSHQGKPLIVDLFSKVKPVYELDKDLTLHGYFLLKDQRIPFTDCTIIAPATTPWFCYGSLLKTVSPEISFRFLENLPRKITLQDVEDLQEQAEVKRLFQGPLVQDPHPVLKLTDRGGAFANLLMDYNGRSYSFHEPEGKSVRNFKAEQLWEKDLLETGYLKKQMHNSQYYCPLPEVGKSIAFLLEIGWRVIDAKGNQIFLETSRQMDAKQIKERIRVDGVVEFGTFNANLSQIAGAFNRRETFIDLGEGRSGLLREQESLQELFSEGELVSDGVEVSKFQAGICLEMPEVHFAPDLEKLKNIHAETITPDPLFQTTLRPYQLHGFNWIETLYQAGLHGILADEMGLGKTVQALAFLSLKNPQGRYLIVVPASLLFNWERECAKFLPHFPCRRNGGEMLQEGILLVSYHQLRTQIDRFEGIAWDVLILDEAHLIKNPDAEITKAIKRLKSHFRLSMTGTLIENHSRELWSQFSFLMPGLLGERAAFEQNLALSEIDSRYLKRVQKLIHPFILRRRKEEVAKDLPPLEEQTIYIEMGEEQRNTYERFLADAKQGLLKKVSLDGLSKHRMEVFETILRLRQITCHPALIGQNSPSAKLEALLADIETIIAEGKKALVFSQFSSMLHLIAKELQERNIPFVLLEGATRDRESVVKAFQEDPKIHIFLISLKAGGVGLNLTAADYVLLYDPWWNEAAEAQAIGRAHRIGKTKPVIAKRYLAAESIEEKLLRLKAAKQALASTIFEDESGMGSIDIQDLEELFN
jgi:superfamily II DNA or RNA helicase